MSSLAQNTDFVVRDALPLPSDARPVCARADRTDSYEIHVTRSDERR